MYTRRVADIRIPARRALALLLCLAAASAADAQNNSLFQQRSQPASPAQTVRPSPAARPPRDALAPSATASVVQPAYVNPPSNGQAVPIRPRPSVATPEPTVNPVLMQASLIAVAPPQPKKIEIGTFVTIIVREDKTATSDADMENNKEWNVESRFLKWFKFSPEHDLMAQDFTDKPGVTYAYDDQYNGEGMLNRRDSLTTRITARVIDVRPNGTLILEASKEITSDEDGYTMTLTGACRNEDITPNNTVLSTQIADLVVNVQHKGVVRDATRRGWFKRLVDLVNPI